MKCNRVGRVCGYVRIVMVAVRQSLRRVRYAIADPLIRHPIFCLVDERTSSIPTGVCPGGIKAMGIVCIPAIIAICSAFRATGPGMKGVVFSENI